MSRMVAVVTDRPRSLTECIGAERLESFVRLAALHADGWGVAGFDESGAPRRAVSADQLRSADELSAAAGTVRVAAAYLRFASAGSPVTAENVQPFVRGGLGFCHNGALVPAARAHDLLTATERMQLVGTTDSEAYFQLILRHRATTSNDTDLLDAVAVAASQVREAFPDACLNAFVMSESGLAVVHSAGTRPVPHAAFESRGFSAASLPAGHDEGYNQLWTCGERGIRIVATSGIDLGGWEPLLPDTVTWFGVDQDRLTRAL